MQKRPINLRLDADLVDAADYLAAATGTDRTELIARGLRRELLYEGSREFVYVLLDETGEVRYVGRSRDPYQRMRAHIAGARVGGSSAKDAWLAQMLSAGVTPRLAIIDDGIKGEEIAALEAMWIEHFRAGGRLTNGTKAGVAHAEREALTDDDRLDLRIPAALKARMKAAAEADRRSLSSWVIVACEQALAAGAPAQPLPVDMGDVPEEPIRFHKVSAPPRVSAAKTAGLGKGPTKSRPKGG